MPIKLKISKATPPSWYQEFVSEKEAIIIGRDPKNDVPLEGLHGAVSREHAKILRKGKACFLIDLNSMNFTFLNGEKLKPNIEYRVQEGDKIQICDYDIEFSAQELEEAEESQPEPQRVSRPNPFLEDLLELAKVFDRLSSAYDLSETQEKNEDLQEGLQIALKDVGGRKAGEIIGSFLKGQKGAPTASLERESPELDVLSNYDRINRLMNALLEFFVKLIQARLQFRQEFLEETIKKTKTFSLDSCTLESLKDFLFDPEIPPEEAKKRIARISSSFEELLLHQVSLLEGYKVSVNEGTKRFLERLNPAKLKNQVAERKAHLGIIEIPYRYLPLLKLFKLINSYARSYGELTAEDQAYIEQKYFRPAYKSSYYKCARASEGKKPGLEK